MSKTSIGNEISGSQVQKWNYSLISYSTTEQNYSKLFDDP